MTVFRGFVPCISQDTVFFFFLSFVLSSVVTREWHFLKSINNELK